MRTGVHFTSSSASPAETISTVEASVKRSQSNRHSGELIMRADRYSSIVSGRSEEHTSEIQSLMRQSYAVFCLKKKKEPNIENRKECSITTITEEYENSKE